ncbi:MAG: prepilin-type N-terminal cleavage/methylation domain-containing protein [Thermodesulfovibrionales bacterium]
MKQQHHKYLKALCLKRKRCSELVFKHNALRTTHYALRITNHAFTLIELMIALFIGMIIIGTTYAIYISQQRSFTSQDQVAEMNSTSKIAIDMISNDIRETGFGVPDDLRTIQRKAGCQGINGYLQKINIVNRNDDTDEITILGGFRLVGNIVSDVTAGTTTLKLTNTEILNNTDRSYISFAGTGFAIVKDIKGNTITLFNSTPANKVYPSGTPVYLVENITYQVTNRKLQRVRRLNIGSCGTNPDIDVIAENIDDLQIAEVDTDGDGTTDRIRINLLARAPKPDPNFQGKGNPPIQIEDRKHKQTNDGFRRRWWQMEVDLRNKI